MTTCNFLFDVILTKFKSRVDIADPKKLNVGINFNNKSIFLTESRINVTAFKPGSETEFNVKPEQLRQSLEKCGMPITVKYNGRLLGTANLSFPQNIVDSIAEGMPDLIHTDTCNFGRDAEVLGTLELLCRLTIKCDEGKPRESINKQDILFIMSETQRCPYPCDPCLDTRESEEGDGLLKIDIGRYQSLDTGALKHEDISKYNPVGDSVCSELKKMALEYEQIIESVLKSSGQPQSIKSLCRPADALSSPCGTPCHYPETTNQPNLAPSHRVSRHFCSPKRLAMSTSERESNIKPIPSCPAMGPKFFACPKCGVKSIPVFHEANEDKKQTADKILVDYLGKPPATLDQICKNPCDQAAENKTSEKLTKFRCSCKNDKFCAYCRVRKLCSNCFKYDEKVQSAINKKESLSEDYCVINVKSKVSQPFLARVFSELRELYDIENTKKESEHQMQNQHKVKECRLRKVKGAPIVDGKKQTKQSITNRALDELVEHKRLNGMGHKNCTKRMVSVSRRHGWDWASSKEAQKHGWRPGAILRPMKKIMNFFLYSSAEHSAYYACKEQMQMEKERERQMPILNLCKKDGAIFITLRALNNPNVEMKPIVFKLVKSDLAVALSQIKRKLKAKGFRKCICHNTVMMCVCRNGSEKKHLEYALQKECKRRGMKNCVDRLVLTDTSDSEMEFDFDVTAPAKVAKPPSPLKPYGVNINTQTVQDDVNVPPSYPITYSPNWRAYDCAVGDRYTGTAFGGPYETVFEDGVFGYRAGGPHGTSATPGGRTKSKSIWGAKPGGPMRGGGRTVPMGSPGGVSFPGAKKKRGKSDPIPVRMPKRYYKAIEDASKAIAAAKKIEKSKKRKGPDMMKYLMKKGDISTPWNPNANA